MLVNTWVLWYVMHIPLSALYPQHMTTYTVYQLYILRIYVQCMNTTITSARCIDVLALLWLVAHLNGQVDWVSLHVLSFILLLLPCWWPLLFWTLNIITEATQHIPIQYHHPLQMHFPSRGIVYDTVIFSPPQPLPKLVRTCYFANHTSPNSSHFLLFTYFGWQIPIFK